MGARWIWQIQRPQDPPIETLSGFKPLVPHDWQATKERATGMPVALSLVALCSFQKVSKLIMFVVFTDNEVFKLDDSPSGILMPLNANLDRD
jgi:hypothetical protein